MFAKEKYAILRLVGFGCRWCSTKPVATNGFTLTGLRAKMHLVDISVRCQNVVGWSDPSEVLPEVYTGGETSSSG